jgi:quercetin dioxygenase-like cupin family protein
MLNPFRVEASRPVFSAAASLLGILLLAGGAAAGECPADKIGVDVTTPGATEPSGVVDNVLASIDLGAEMIRADGRNLRLRQLVIQPGGVVPWHSHGDRPAIIYVVSGSVTEYASTCAVPIVHNAGEVAPETHGTSHWWKNTGAGEAVLLSADILHDESEKDMM